MRYISVYPSFKSGFRDSLLVSMYTPTWREREREGGGGQGGSKLFSIVTRPRLNPRSHDPDSNNTSSKERMCDSSKANF